MFSVKLLKVKKYLNENLSKRFITSSQTLYFFLVLFALKANEDFRFCVNYQKLNVIFKRNRYSLSLINEIIDKIVSCKHLTRLNIISAFNKLQMHLDNENYITFITALEAYKYKMLSFELTNKSMPFQQYMNDVLCRLIASGRVFEFESSTRLEKCRVGLKFFWKSVGSSWEVEFEHSNRVEKLDPTIRPENSIRLDKILGRCK